MASVGGGSSNSNSSYDPKANYTFPLALMVTLFFLFGLSLNLPQTFPILSENQPKSKDLAPIWQRPFDTVEKYLHWTLLQGL